MYKMDAYPPAPPFSEVDGPESSEIDGRSSGHHGPQRNATPHFPNIIPEITALRLAMEGVTAHVAEGSSIPLPLVHRLPWVTKRYRIAS